MRHKEEIIKIKEIFSNLNLQIKKFKLFEIKGGKNNRGFKVINNGLSYFAKFYFHDEERNKSRIETESNFFSFIKNKKIKNIPKPINFSIDHNIGIFEFIEGKSFTNENQINEECVKQAADFFSKINENISVKSQMNNASDAEYSLKGNFSLIESRIEKLKEIKIKHDVDIKAKNLVIELSNFWNSEKIKINSEFIKNKFNDLDKDQRCISPSDFGFHNALIDENQTVYFLDFEHAGFDDPSKFICDFFLQPKISVSMKYFDYFTRYSLINFSNKESIIKRSLLMFPLFKVKWISILLNEFLEENLKRRIFSKSLENIEKQKALQLGKAKKLFSELT